MNNTKYSSKNTAIYFDNLIISYLPCKIWGNLSRENKKAPIKKQHPIDGVQFTFVN